MFNIHNIRPLIGNPENSWMKRLPLECPECGGRKRILCALNPPDVIRKILDCLGMLSQSFF